MAETRARQKQALFWLAVGIAFVLAILLLQAILLPFVAGLVLAYALDPLVERLEKWGLGRLLASSLIVLLLLVVLVLVLVFLVPLLLTQAQQFISSVPAEIERIVPQLQAWARNMLGPRFEEVSTAIDQALVRSSANWTGYAGVVLQSIVNRGGALLDLLSILFITPIVVFYWLVDWPTMLKKLGDLLPRDHETTLRRLAGDVNLAVAAFIRGQGVVCLSLGTLYTIGLSLIGLDYGLLIGIATGVMSFVPVVGTVLGLVTASIVAVMQGWPDLSLLAMVVAIFVAGQALDSGFLSPRIVGPAIGLHPVALIFALIVFSYLFGFVGVLVAVPVSAAIAVMVRFGLELYLNSPIYKGSGTGTKPTAKTVQRSEKS
ncbi:MAG: putative PurR-regulated permease PerM [Hyphomicrobiaceae bacterium]|jgi:predicted PurR-regulated permease PerM